MQERVRLERRGGTGLILLNEPASRNALSLAMMGDLANSLREMEEEPGLRCLVIASSGPAFCAGHDLKEITAMRQSPDGGQAAFEDLMARCSSLMRAVQACPKPVIAAVEGMATAAGCQLVASCDLAIAGEKARFCTPGVNIGLFCSTPMIAIGRSIGRKHMMQMLLEGESVTAADAFRMGLVNEVVNSGEALVQALACASRLATKSAIAIQHGKALAASLDAGLGADYAAASRVMVENLLAQEAIEGIDAFLTKRQPHWDQE